jgi:hypothetical protein
MVYHLAAVAVLLLHLTFILFVLAGAILGARWPRALAVHLPAAAWGTFVELGDRICPLTGLENHLRLLAGLHGYAGGFIQHYLLALIYPDGLTRQTQLGLGALVIAVNAAIYGWLILRWRRRERRA